ncbi:MAG TPA: alternative ribosome rescue aminoacyl-tRNA hydrolase ArfB [Candidatus Acidoferrales bacterium]|nr:alternative ribosome rescue aminoacyl-tRNA hydrolase ArfB [Candidatus Acidoferrales bacterium]
MNPGFIKVSSQLVIPFSEISFRSSRSGGPGGQNVNKVESRVELIFNVNDSQSLSDEQRSKILVSLKNKIDLKGILHLTSQKSRSQWENKETIIAEFVRVIRAAINPVKKRIRTRPSNAVKEKRLREKRMISEKKRIRKTFDSE